MPADFVLEVSSPGVERPLVRPRDYERFAGREARLNGYAPLAGRSRSLRGRLLGVVPSVDATVRVAIEVAGERVEVPLEEIANANLVTTGRRTCRNGRVTARGGRPKVGARGDEQPRGRAEET